jgi:hypothetical protein
LPRDFFWFNDLSQGKEKVDVAVRTTGFCQAEQNEASQFQRMRPFVKLRLVSVSDSPIAKYITLNF